METKEAYKNKLKTQLAEWEAQINLFEAKTKNAAADVRIKMRRFLAGYSPSSAKPQRS